MARQNSSHTHLDKLDAYDADKKGINTIIETPKGGRIKYKYDTATGLFKVSKFLPMGAVFPYDFGFVPGTLGEDGDPLDMLVLMDEPAITGSLVVARLIGVIEAEQTEAGKTERNDRIIAVSAISHIYNEVNAISDLSENILNEIEHFFISYNQLSNREFKPLGQFGPQRAQQLITRGIALFNKKTSGIKPASKNQTSKTTGKKAGQKSSKKKSSKKK
jgi:inorganic pyrophosphatase